MTTICVKNGSDDDYYNLSACYRITHHWIDGSKSFTLWLPTGTLHIPERNHNYMLIAKYLAQVQLDPKQRETLLFEGHSTSL